MDCTRMNYCWVWVIVDGLWCGVFEGNWMQLTMLNKSLYSFSIITFQLFLFITIYFRGTCNNNSRVCKHLGFACYVTSNFTVNLLTGIAPSPPYSMPTRSSWTESCLWRTHFKWLSLPPTGRQGALVHPSYQNLERIWVGLGSPLTLRKK